MNAEALFFKSLGGLLSPFLDDDVFSIRATEVASELLNGLVEGNFDNRFEILSNLF